MENYFDQSESQEYIRIIGSKNNPENKQNTCANIGFSTMEDFEKALPELKKEYHDFQAFKGKRIYEFGPYIEKK